MAQHVIEYDWVPCEASNLFRTTENHLVGTCHNCDLSLVGHGDETYARGRIEKNFAARKCEVE